MRKTKRRVIMIVTHEVVVIRPVAGPLPKREEPGSGPVQPPENPGAWRRRFATKTQVRSSGRTA